jgi:hypothetical protein
MTNFKQDLNKIRKYHKNPRFITKDQVKKLKSTLDKFGELGIMVINVRTWEIASGNQRSTHIDPKTAIITEECERTPAGTVGWGYIENGLEKHPVRFVDWDEETEEEAVLVANKGGGNFDYDVLNNEFALEVLEAAGFTKDELAGHFDDAEDLLDDVSDTDFEHDDEKFVLQVIFRSEEDREIFFNELEVTYSNDPTITWHKA